MLLVSIDFKCNYIKKWCSATGVYECKSCEISNQAFFSVTFSFLKTKKNWLWYKYCKIKLTRGAISHGAPNEPETYLEPSQTYRSH